MSTRAGKVQAPRMRTTIVLEYETQEAFDKALKLGVQSAREGFIGIKFRPKDDAGEHGPTIEVRTTRARRKS